MAPVSDWPVQACGELPAPDSQSYAELRSAATEILWALSGRRFGTAEVTVRPCRQQGSWPTVGPALQDGRWVNISCRSCLGEGRRCSCPEVSELMLPGPVQSVTEVKLGAAVVAPASYRVDDLLWLVRQDGGRWPATQNMGEPLGADDTWSVKYERGLAVPSGGQRSMGELMSELWKACCNDGTCCLPKRVRTIAKQGITLGILDPMDFLEKGKTGLYFTDLWLQSVNPQARPQAARISSPDYDPGRVTTWP